MNIQKKIEAIKNEPEHIRIRYVWGCVALSMFFVVSIWIFSVTTMFKQGSVKDNQKDSLTQLKKQIEDVNKQTPSLKDLPKELNIAGENSGTSVDSVNDSSQSGSQDVVESAAYSTEE